MSAAAEQPLRVHCPSDPTAWRRKITVQGILRGGQMGTGNEGYAAGWGTLALINAWLTHGKNRSGRGWLI